MWLAAAAALASSRKNQCRCYFLPHLHEVDDDDEDNNRDPISLIVSKVRPPYLFYMAVHFCVSFVCLSICIFRYLSLLYGQFVLVNLLFSP